MWQRLFIAGASGSVGRELIRQVADIDNIDGHRNPSNIVGVADGENVVASAHGLDRRVLRSLAESRGALKTYLKSEGEPFTDMRQLVDKARELGLDGEVIFVDVTSEKEGALGFHKYVLDSSANKIVTANKNPVALYSMDDFKGLTRHHGRYNYDATVMAGKGAIDYAIRARELRDEIFEIEGMLSGTLGFVFSELAKGERSFSEIVKDAKARGYTETNPFHDLNGVDVARKLVILVRSAGYDVDFKDVERESLLDDKFDQLAGDDFWVELEKEDGRFAAMVAQAKRDGKVLRYTAKMVKEGSRVRLVVAPSFHGPESPFYALNGTSNKVLFKSPIIKSGHIIESPGAGLDVTAASVRDGIRRMVPADYLRA